MISNKHQETGFSLFPIPFRKLVTNNERPIILFPPRLEVLFFTVVLIYVDDILLTDNDLQEMEHLKKFLFKHFRMKDLGDLKYFLGIEFFRLKKDIFMFQRKYALDIL